MAQYLVLLEGLAAQIDRPDAQAAAHNERWLAWVAGLAREGKLAGGGPLGVEAKGVSRDGVADRPLGTVDVFGYLLLEATSLDEAAGIVSEAPNVALGGTAVVRPVLAVGPGAG
jgi:hypothetical protein